MNLHQSNDMWKCPNCGLLLSNEQYAAIKENLGCPECGHRTIMFDEVSMTAALVQTGKTQTVSDYLQQMIARNHCVSLQKEFEVYDASPVSHAQIAVGYAMQAGKTLEMQQAIADAKEHGVNVVEGKKSSNENTTTIKDIYQDAVYRAIMDGDQSAQMEFGIDPGSTFGVDVTKNGCIIHPQRKPSK